MLIPDILYEDNHLVVVNKKPGQIVQTDKTGDVPLESIVAQYIAAKYNKPGKAFIGVVHRLDRPVSGVVVFARNSKALSRMNLAFHNKEVEKVYWAVVFGSPKPHKQVLINYLARDEKKNKSFVVNQLYNNAKIAELQYEVIAQIEKYALLQIHLKTGRHHQIRCQLAHIGFPVRGDLKYGYPRSNNDAGISLHARYIAFNHPVTKESLKIVAPPPDEKIWQLLTGNILSSSANV